MKRAPRLEAVGVRRSMVVGLLTLLVLSLATPAWAQDAQGQEAFVVLSGRADVPRSQTVGDLVVFHGSSTVDGTINGSLTAFDAPVTIAGRVNGDVVVFNGRVERRRVQTNIRWDGFGWVGRLAWWLAVSVSTLVVGLVLLWLAGRGAAWILEAGRTLVGLPLGLGLLAALGLIYALGYSASAWILGRSLLRAPAAWVVAFLVGWAILRVVALIPILGGLVWFAAVVFGLGALVVAVWWGRSAARVAPAAA